MVTHIAFTMYPVKDLTRARRFYEEDLGLVLTRSFYDCWYEYDMAGGCFAMTTTVEGLTPSATAGGRLAFEVDDVDGCVEQLRAKGIQVEREPFSTPVCRMAVVVDPEGNAVILHKVAKAA